MVRLVLALHNHQPVGNFDDVFQAARRDSYLPFLDVLERYPHLPISLHTSGSLLEWLAEHEPGDIDRIRSFVDRGQIEILGGPFYEPILSSIRREDRIGQIQAYTAYLKNLFGCDVRGMWVPERVWEAPFAGDLTEAGIEYTLLDDFHFQAGGLRGEELFGYYVAEDQGRLLKVFPGSELMRYVIPYSEPDEIIDALRKIGQSNPNAVVVCGDDGEKFGTWPESHKHCYEDGWLDRFFATLSEHQDWLKVTTLREAVDNLPPRGRVYLPDCSYREMTEWALPTPVREAYHRAAEHAEAHTDWEQLKPFVRGGFWRNFLAKYPESNEMYCRQHEISRRLQDTWDEAAGNGHLELLTAAKTHLYRGQCNCPYWHGAFGGLYLPHLRNAIYRELIAADNRIERAAGRPQRWVELLTGDFNLDARQEVRMAGDRLVAYLAPARGGHLYELDIRDIEHNVLATLNRRPEPYHRKIIESVTGDQSEPDDQAISIHDIVKCKQPDLDKKIQYDAWPRKGLVDHFFREDVTLDTFRESDGEVGDFLTGVYETKLRRSDNVIQTVMTRGGSANGHAVRVTKTVTLESERGHQLHVRYELDHLPPNVRFHFGVEFNFAGMAAGADDRYLYCDDGHRLGQLQTEHSLDCTDRVGLVDEWLGLDASLQLSQQTGVWILPIQTVSQSEGGFELVHQSTAVVPHWLLTADADGRWAVEITLALNTSTIENKPSAVHMDAARS